MVCRHALLLVLTNEKPSRVTDVGGINREALLRSVRENDGRCAAVLPSADHSELTVDALESLVERCADTVAIVPRQSREFIGDDRMQLFLTIVDRTSSAVSIVDREEAPSVVGATSDNQRIDYHVAVFHVRPILSIRVGREANDGAASRAVGLPQWHRPSANGAATRWGGSPGGLPTLDFIAVRRGPVVCVGDPIRSRRWLGGECAQADGDSRLRSGRLRCQGRPLFSQPPGPKVLRSILARRLLEVRRLPPSGDRSVGVPPLVLPQAPSNATSRRRAFQQHVQVVHKAGFLGDDAWNALPRGASPQRIPIAAQR
mmetsp:Transcript_21787/g.60862  ORF Transcript_21787/g.60862 Transcript_21787/m.60862 type:complete len:315 (+) Transcript_21787:593-1537(+)